MRQFKLRFIIAIGFSLIGAQTVFAQTTQPAIPEHFENPVYTKTGVADPFCWYFQGTYYVCGTGLPDAEHRRHAHSIPIVKSNDLQHWEPVQTQGLDSPKYAHGDFWAPEVSYDEKAKTFYMYYSAGDQRGFAVRVAQSKSPAGPFTDLNELTDLKEHPFCIDPDVFQDDDRERYLIFVTEYLDEAPYRGVALVMQHMKSMTEVDGPITLIVRPQWRWQLYLKQRLMYGKVGDWYTVEGPEMVKRNGKYYCFYSGGNFANATYGLSYLVADSLKGPWTDAGEFRGAQVTRTIPGKVVGPGHGCIVRSPDGKRDFLMYHAWNDKMTQREMWVDPIVWTAKGPVVERFVDVIKEANSVAEEAKKAGEERK